MAGTCQEYSFSVFCHLGAVKVVFLLPLSHLIYVLALHFCLSLSLSFFALFVIYFHLIFPGILHHSNLFIYLFLIAHSSINYERLLYRYKGCRDNPENAAHCKYWTKKGECTQRPGFMKQHCNQTCGFCSEYILQCFNGAKILQN